MSSTSLVQSNHSTESKEYKVLHDLILGTVFLRKSTANNDAAISIYQQDCGRFTKCDDPVELA